jgi:dienelactone hydrolase
MNAHTDDADVFIGASLAHPGGRLVILGSGWGGFNVLRYVNTKPYETVCFICYHPENTDAQWSMINVLSTTDRC